MKRFLVVVALAGFAFVATAPAWAAAHGAPKKEAEKKDEKKPAKKAPAPKKEGEGEGKVGYSTTVIQMMPIMAPYRTSSGTRYELVSVRLELPPDEKTELQRGACFMVPVVHEKLLLYLATANLQLADFSGQRKEVLAKNLYDVVVQATDKSLYTGLRLVDPTSPPLTEIGADTRILDNDPPLSQRSQTLSAQCK